MRLSSTKVTLRVLDSSTVWFHLKHLLLQMTLANSVPIRTPAQLGHPWNDGALVRSS